MYKLALLIAAATAQQLDECPMIEIDSNLDKARLTGEWYTQSYHSLNDWDIKCRH